jgi:hypothetical protein
VLQKEIDALIEADDVFIIGWSLPPTDAYQLQLIAGAISKRRKPFRRVVIIVRHPDAQHYRRIKNIFSPMCYFETWGRGFERYANRSIIVRAWTGVLRFFVVSLCSVVREVKRHLRRLLDGG